MYMCVCTCIHALHDTYTCTDTYKYAKRQQICAIITHASRR